MTDTSDSDLGKNGKDNLKEILAAGSRALLNNSPLEASENFRSVLDKMSCKSNQKMPITQVVLRYALCIALIKCKDYKHIAESAKGLMELIDSGCANKLPALYLALARAFYVLNRFTKSSEFIERGLKAIQTNSKVKQHLWPGLQQPIEETSKEFLQKELLSLQKDCKMSQPPDAICGFDQCLECSDHLIPARDIFFTDPDLEPFLCIQCDASCKFFYHQSCWKHFIQDNLTLEEPKDLLGAPCFSDTCRSKLKTGSVVEVKLIGSNGFDKPLNTWPLQDPEHSNSKLENQLKFDSLSTKTDNVSSTSSNGSPLKSSVKESSTGVRTSGEVQCSATNFSGSSEDRGTLSLLGKPIIKKHVTRAPQITIHDFSQACSTASISHQYQASYSSIPRSTLPTGYPTDRRTLFAPFNTRPPFQVRMNPPPVYFSYPSAQAPPFWPAPTAQNLAYFPTRPEAAAVEVIVRNTAVLQAGTTLLVPIGPHGGAVQIKSYGPSGPGSRQTIPAHLKAIPPAAPAMKFPVKSAVNDFENQVKMLSDDPLPNVSLSQSTSAASSTCESEDPTNAPIKSVVNDFKSVVRKLAGEPSTRDALSDEMKNEPVPFCSEDLSMKQVVKEFQKLVHNLAGSDTSKCSKNVPKLSPVQKEAAPAALDVNRNYQQKPAPNACTSIAPLEFCSPPDSTIYPKNNPTLSERFMTSSSTLQANSKSSHLKENESLTEQSFVISSSLAHSIYSSQDDIRSDPLDSSKLEYLLEILNECRKIEFGYSKHEYMNPELQCFGHPYADFSTYIVPEEIDKADKAEADFVFSYYYSMFEKNGLHRLEDLQETWKATISDDIGLPETFTHKYSSVSEFLLKSERFAAIDDVIGTYELLPDMFSKAQVEITESVQYLLFSQVSIDCIKDEHFTSDILNDPCKKKINNNNCDGHHSPTPSLADTDDYVSDSDDCTPDSDEYERSNTDLMEDKDKNDNPICSDTVSVKKPAVTLEINGGFKPSSELCVPRGSNISPKPEVVYMSDDDEEIESGNEVLSLLNMPVDPVPWSQGYNKPVVVDQDSQTEAIIDKEKEMLLKQVAEFTYEKEELHRRIEYLQLQMESNRSSQDSHHAKVLKQVQEKHNELLQKKTEELIKNQDKYCALELELTQLKVQMKDKESKVSDLDLTLQKVHRSHAKEMNNFVKRAQEEKLRKEEELKNVLMQKDQRYIQLWKDFCEFKIKKFNQSCNDRINVLSQLRDLVSDSIRPTKSDIKSTVEKYEEEMIAVTQKNAEVNDMFNQQMEKLKNGLEIQLLSVVDVPDTMNMHYPPEGAFEYLHSMIKPKQEEFAVPLDHFSPPVSRFYPNRYQSNGLPPLTQPRENEAFPSSLFGQGHNETSHLWNNSFPAAPTSVASVNKAPLIPLPNFHQGFSASNPLMPQPSLNLMTSMMQYQSSSSQNMPVPSIIGRTTPSPLFSAANGTNLNSNTAASSVLGSKAPLMGATQKSAAPVSIPAAKTVPLLPPSASQGAIPKPRVQTATASLTPIVPAKPLVRPLLKSSRTNESNYEKLMRNLQKMFPTRNDMELTQALKITREKNGHTLSSLSHSEIVSKVEEVFNVHFRKQTSMAWEKFGQAAWGTAKASVIEWDGQEQDECCICMAAMHAREVYTLECKHAFHKDCIRKWLEQDSVCPNCRTHSTMLDEFPPLG